MKKSTYILLGSLMAVSLGGYLLTETPESMPTRILMQNAGGRVVFDHAGHIGKYDIACIDCHHDAASSEKAGLACKTCHLQEALPYVPAHKASADKYSCATCHHAFVEPKNWYHDKHGQDFAGYFDKDCTACHHGPQLEPTPQNCADCHDKVKNQGTILSLKNAVHTRCAECHEGPGLPQSDSDYRSKKTCTTCHSVQSSRKLLDEGKNIDKAFVRCSTCHDVEHSKLIPASMAAYHKLCMDCHKKKGGPVDNCAQCHTK
ncbi:MAG: cytochrome c3 family protein [Mailhella sp.]|nr:cytochrome c3 family protein [Mailhella sp.]